MDSTNLCGRLHRLLGRYPEYRYPIDWTRLPDNGVYFFYEEGETWGHGRPRPRIVRVGTHREGNLVSRLRSHYVDEEKITRITKDTACPKDRSIFRKNIGRALLQKAGSSYLPTWEIDFQLRAHRQEFGRRRDVGLEKQVEREITGVLRRRFSFRVIPTGKHEAVIGADGLEARLIGTVAQCGLCKPSTQWLGAHSTIAQIRGGKLWLVQHLQSGVMNAADWMLCQRKTNPG